MTADYHCRPLTPGIGAEVTGFDIAAYDGDAFARLHADWLTHKVLFIRDQAVDLDNLLHFSADFGELMRLPYIRPLADYPNIIRVLKQADEIDMGVFGGEWHSDFSFIEAPPKASILMADEPTGNLDSKNGNQVMELLTELNQEGTTIVMVTHSNHDAGFAHRVINLFDGQILTETENEPLREAI